LTFGDTAELVKEPFGFTVIKAAYPFGLFVRTGSTPFGSENIEKVNTLFPVEAPFGDVTAGPLKSSVNFSEVPNVNP